MLAEKFEGQFMCLGENTEKLITFSVPMQKEFKRIGKNGDEIIKTICYKFKLIDSERFMACSLSNLINNLVNMDKIIKKCETCGVKYKDCDVISVLNTQTSNI